MANAKTLRKRISLVAATALGVGLLVATPASAANLASSAVNSITLTAYTAAPTVGSLVAVNAGAAFTSTTTTAGDTTKFVGYLSSYPSGGFAQMTPSANLGAGGVGTANTGFTTSVSGSGLIETAAGTTTNSASTVASSTTVGIGSFSFTPTVAGTYVLTVWNDADVNGVVNIGEAVQTVTITVAAVTTSSYSSNLSTAFIASGAAAGVSPDAAVSANKTPTSTQAGNITVTLKNSNGTAMNGETLVATVAGPGTIGITASPTTYNQASAGRALTQALGASNNIGNISVWPDGTSGVSTITISVTDATSGATTVLATKSVTFYGAVASITPTVASNLIAVGAPNTATNTNTGAITVVAKDANGVVIQSGTVYATSATATVVGDSYAAITITAGVGTYSPTGLAVGTTAITFTDGSTAALSTVTSAPSTLTVASSTPASVSIAFDKATYAPGEKMTLTLRLRLPTVLLLPTQARTATPCSAVPV